MSRTDTALLQRVLNMPLLGVRSPTGPSRPVSRTCSAMPSTETRSIMLGGRGGGGGVETGDAPGSCRRLGDLVGVRHSSLQKLYGFSQHY